MLIGRKDHNHGDSPRVETPRKQNQIVDGSQIRMDNRAWDGIVEEIVSVGRVVTHKLGHERMSHGCGNS